MAAPAALFVAVSSRVASFIVVVRLFIVVSCTVARSSIAARLCTVAPCASAAFIIEIEAPALRRLLRSQCCVVGNTLISYGLASEGLALLTQEG